jgi:hypothetical protein
MWKAGLVAWFLGVAIPDIARLAARSFIVILESIPLLLMSGNIFPYPLPRNPSSSVLTPYPQSEP